MKLILPRGCSLAVLSLACIFQAAFAAADAPKIRMNTIGYLPGREHRASIAADCINFTVVRLKDGAKVFEAAVSGPATNSDTGELLYTADFSPLKESGEFRLEAPGVGQSPPFRIGAEVYRQPFQLVTRGMYLWRCGMAVTGTNNGSVFHHEACHTNDAWLDFVGATNTMKDGSRGWHDAGDYNKYVVNAGITVGGMFRAWEEFGSQITKVNLGLPESGGPLPDFLAELKWETDWLLTMQAEDGSVYHKLSTQKFGAFIMPELETAKRFFTPWGSAATADFAAMMAMAARDFRPYNAAYADECLAAAKKSYEFLQTNPDNHAPDQRGFSTGGYGTRDPDERLWAAAELWETTGESSVLGDLENRIRAVQGTWDLNFDWGEVKNLGLITYLFSKRSGRDAALVTRARDNLLTTADSIVQTARSHGYARPLGTRYYWGGNGGVARQTFLLQAAYRVSGKRVYRDVALDALNHLFGRNCDGRSYVTGLGYRPPMHPHDRRSGADQVEDPWPGYLVGGPNPRATSWNDSQEDYRTNEIAINWNGALIYALAAYLEDAP